MTTADFENLTRDQIDEIIALAQRKAWLELSSLYSKLGILKCEICKDKKLIQQWTQYAIQEVFPKSITQEDLK